MALGIFGSTGSSRNGPDTTLTGEHCVKYMHGKLDWEPRRRPSKGIKSAREQPTNLGPKPVKCLPPSTRGAERMDPTVPAAQEMHGFVLWQLLRDETKFCWEVCPLPTAHTSRATTTTTPDPWACPSPTTTAPQPLYQCFAHMLYWPEFHGLPSVLDDACVTSVTLDKV